MKKILTFGIMLLFILMTVSSTTGFNVEQSNLTTSNSKTLYVGGSGPGNYSSIQDAIDNASDGDTVFVYDDSSPYNESIRVNKSINLIGEKRETTIIEGLTRVDANWLNISEFTLQFGIRIFVCNNVIITGNKITTAPHRSIGIWISSSRNIIIRFNTIYKNFFGLTVDTSINCIFEKNNFIDNRIQASFSFIASNVWDSNYWDRLIGNRPKIIFGSFFLWGLIPWINLDKNPVQEPYDI